MQWGFKSAWSKQPLINAKAETIATTASKQHLHHRCLIPADGTNFEQELLGAT